MKASAYVEALNDASREAFDEILKLAEHFDLDTPEGMSDFRDAWLEIIRDYGNYLKPLASRRYSYVRRKSVSRPYRAYTSGADVARKYAIEAFNKVMDKELSGDLGDDLANLRLVTDQMVKQAPRNVMIENAIRDPWCRGFIRVPHGEMTCAFCVMLASRAYDPEGSGLYKTRYTAGDKYTGNEFHGDCDCTVEPVFSTDSDYARIAEEYPGFDPEKFFEQYSHGSIEAGSTTDTSAILAKMRKKFNMH